MRTRFTLKEALNFLGSTKVWVKAPRERNYNYNYINTTNYFLTEPEEEIKELLYREVESIEKTDSKLSHYYFVIRLTIPE